MRLYLVRHGEAHGKDVDPERGLTGKGRSDVERVASFLASAGTSVSRIAHSGKKRAAQTASILASALGAEGAVEEASGLQPNDPVEPWAEEAGAWPDDVMIVGHLPFMDKLLSRLAAGNEAASAARFEAGAAACLERDAKKGWILTSMVSPSLLRE